MKAKKIAAYILGGFLSVAFAFGGLMDIFSGSLLQQMASYNYPAWFTRLLGVGKIVFAAGLWAWKGKYAKLSLFFLFGIMSGAIGTHVAAGDPFTNSIAALVTGVLILIYASLKYDLFIEN